MKVYSIHALLKRVISKKGLSTYTYHIINCKDQMKTLSRNSKEGYGWTHDVKAIY